MRLLTLFAVLLCAISAMAAAPTALTVVSITPQDVALANNATDRTNGNKVANANCDVFLFLKNAHASNPGSVIIRNQLNAVQVPGFGSLTLGSLVVTLAVGEVRHVGPFSCASWNNSDGNVIVEYNQTGEIQVSPLRAVRP